MLELATSNQYGDLGTLTIIQALWLSFGGAICVFGGRYWWAARSVSGPLAISPGRC